MSVKCEDTMFHVLGKGNLGRIDELAVCNNWQSIMYIGLMLITGRGVRHTSASRADTAN